MTKEALKMALEAMELSAVTVDSFDVQRKTYQAITALEKALAQPEQEPDDLTIAYLSGLHDGKKKLPWVGLTDEEIQSYWDGALSPYQMQCIREIEDKLKEKNNG